MADYTLSAKVTAEESGFTKAMAKVKDSLDDVTKHSSSFGANFAANIASSAVMGAIDTVKTGLDKIVTGLGLVGGYVMQTGMAFESGMSEVAAISGAQGEELDKLTDKAEEMGAKTKFTATEAAEAFKYMAMAGWKTGDMLDGIEGVMNLAAASGEDLGTVSDIVTDSLTAFGMTAEDTGHYVDVLAAAATNSNTDVAMMGESFKFAAPLAGAFGYKAEDVAVALGLMANAGIKSGIAGRSLRAFFNNFATSDKAQQKLKELGIELYTSTGEARPLLTVMKELRASMGNLHISSEELTSGLAYLDTQLAAGNITEKEYEEGVENLTERAFGAEGALKAQAAAALAGTTGMSGLLAILNASEEDFNNLTTAIYDADGSASNMAATMNDNLGGAITILKSGIEGFALSVYKNFSGPLQGVTTELQKVVNKAKEGFNQGVGTGLQDSVANAAGNITRALQGVDWKTFGAAAGEVITKVVDVIGTLMEKAAEWAANADWDAIADDIVNVVDTIGNQIMNIDFETIKTQVTELFEGVKNFITGINWGTVVSVITEIFAVVQSVITFITSHSEQILTIIGAIAAAIAALQIAAFISNIIDIITVIGSLITAAGGITSIFGAVAAFLTGPVGIAIAAIVAAIAGVVLAVTHWGEITAWFKDTQEKVVIWLSEAWESVKNTLSETWDNLKQWFQDTWDSMLHNPVVEDLVNNITGLWEGAKQTLDTILENVQNIFTNYWEIIKNVVGGVVLIICDLVSGDFDKLKEDLGHIWDNIKNAFSEIWESIKTIFTTVLTTMQDKATEIWEGIKKFFAEKGEQISKAMKDSFNKFVEFMKNLPGKAWGWISDTWTKMKDYLVTAGPQIAEAAKNAFNDFVTWITNLPAQAWQWGADIISSITDGIWACIGNVQSAASSVADTIRNFLGFSEPEEGPLSNFHTYMPDMIDLMATGIRRNLPTLAGAAESAAALLAGTFGTVTVDGMTHGSSQRGYETSPAENRYVTNAPQISVYARDGQSARSIAQEVADIIMAEAQRS